jgi:hypothetical protein
VHLTDVQLIDGTYHVAFETNYDTSPAEDGFTPEPHVHFFWDVDPRAGSGDVRAQAGINGEPEPCGCWVAYGGGSPLEDPQFAVELRPEGATEICALVATPMNDPNAGPHEIADVDGDGEPDPDSGDCFPLPPEED